MLLDTDSFYKFSGGSPGHCVGLLLAFSLQPETIVVLLPLQHFESFLTLNTHDAVQDSTTIIIFVDFMLVQHVKT